MQRKAIFVLLAVFFAAGAGNTQNSSPGSAAPPSAAQAESKSAQTVSERVAAAEAAIASSDMNTAQTRLDSWLASHPGDARALFDAGYVADAQNRPDDAASLYRRALAANPASLEAHLSLGLLLARQGNFKDARPELAAATTLDPGEAGPPLKARAWRALARIDSESDPKAASAELLEALKLSPETPEDTLLTARLAEKTRQLDVAEAAYRRVLEKAPKSEPANAGLAHLLIQKKQYPEAETLLRAALQQSPGDPALTAQLATVLVAQDKGEALPLLQKLHDAFPSDAAITHMLAEVLADAGDSAGSDQLYVKLLAAAPQDPALLVAHGQNLVRLIKYADAYTVFDKATSIDPASAEGWSGLAFAASRTGRAAVALHALTMRSKYLPENSTTYFLWATAYDTLHQKVQAADYYHRFLNSSAGKFPDQEWQARQRLLLLEK